MAAKTRLIKTDTLVIEPLLTVSPVDRSPRVITGAILPNSRENSHGIDNHRPAGIAHPLARANAAFPGAHAGKELLQALDAAVGKGCAALSSTQQFR